MSLVVGVQEAHLPPAAFLTQAPRTILLIYPVSSLLYKEQRLHARVVRKFLLSDAVGGSRVLHFMESRIGSSQSPHGCMWLPKTSKLQCEPPLERPSCSHNFESLMSVKSL